MCCLTMQYTVYSPFESQCRIRGEEVAVTADGGCERVKIREDDVVGCCVVCVAFVARKTAKLKIERISIKK
jgi:hypothetical protein